MSPRPEDNILAGILGKVGSTNSSTSAFARYLEGLQLPQTPSKWTKNYLSSIVNRGNRRIEVLGDRLQDVADGRVMPDRDDITIGSGKRFEVAVLFLDVCAFSSRPSWTPDEQRIALVIMDIFMAEMLSIVSDFSGTYEKNTGDGLMAYFGETGATASERVKPALEAAVVMHYVNDRLITPWLAGQGIEPVKFRVGIDHGPVTIARVGIRGEKNSRVAIGTTTNLANKLMSLIPNGGICIGQYTYENLPANWNQSCRPCVKPTGFVYVATQAPYPAWELTHRLAPPAF